MALEGRLQNTCYTEPWLSYMLNLFNSIHHNVKKPLLFPNSNEMNLVFAPWNVCSENITLHWGFMQKPDITGDQSIKQCLIYLKQYTKFVINQYLKNLVVCRCESTVFYTDFLLSS